MIYFQFQPIMKMLIPFTTNYAPHIQINRTLISHIPRKNIHKSAQQRNGRSVDRRVRLIYKATKQIRRQRTEFIVSAQHLFIENANFLRLILD